MRRINARIGHTVPKIGRSFDETGLVKTVNLFKVDSVTNTREKNLVIYCSAWSSDFYLEDFEIQEYGLSEHRTIVNISIPKWNILNLGPKNRELDRIDITKANPKIARMTLQKVNEIAISHATTEPVEQIQQVFEIAKKPEQSTQFFVKNPFPKKLNDIEAKIKRLKWRRNHQTTVDAIRNDPEKKAEIQSQFRVPVRSKQKKQKLLNCIEWFRIQKIYSHEPKLFWKELEYGQWSTMKYHETLWNIMKQYDEKLSSTKNCHESWKIMKHHEMLWRIM